MAERVDIPLNSTWPATVGFTPLVETILGPTDYITSCGALGQFVAWVVSWVAGSCVCILIGSPTFC